MYADFLFSRRCLTSVLQVAYAHWLMFYMTFWAIKGAILSVYYQLISKSHKLCWVSLNTLSVVASMAFLATVLLSLVWCQPIRLNWSRDPGEICFAPFDSTVIIATGIIQVAIDVTSEYLPSLSIHSPGDLTKD